MGPCQAACSVSTWHCSAALSCCYEILCPAWNLASCYHAGYVIFSISNNSTLFKQSYKKCWSTFTTCNQVSVPGDVRLLCWMCQILLLNMQQIFPSFDWCPYRS